MTTIRVGILGCGGIALSHARRLKEMDEAQVVALCDVNADITESFAKEALEGVELEHFTAPRDMYAQAKLDAVVIATPHTMHFDHGMQALDTGCHVFMEKPMVTQADHAYALADKVEDTGKILVVGYATSCTPELGYLRDKIRSKAFGELELVSGFLCQNWLEFTTGMWRQDPALSGGGQAYDSGAHILNSLVWSVERPVAEVFAFVDNHGTRVDINSVLAIRFEGGLMASLAIGGNCLKGGQHMSFVFENARVEINGWVGGYIRVFADNEPEQPELGEGDGSPLGNFIDAVLGKAEPKTSPVNGIHHTELMDAIYESAKTGQPARPKGKKGRALG